MTNVFALRNATLTTETSGGTATAVAGLRNVEIVPSVDMTRFQTADSIFTEDKMQSNFEVSVSIEYAKFDGDIVGEWLGGDGSTATSMTDTSKPQLFTIEGTFEDRQAANQIDVTVEEIDFEEMPVFSGGEDEYAAWNLEGSGAKLTNFEVTEVV